MISHPSYNVGDTDIQRMLSFILWDGIDGLYTIAVTREQEGSQKKTLCSGDEKDFQSTLSRG